MKKAILLIVLAIPAMNSWADDYTVEITQQQLQQQVTALLPIEREAYFFKVILSDPVIDLPESANELGILTNVTLIGPGGAGGSGRARISGNISYEMQDGSFYLNNPKLTKLEIDQIPERFHEKVRELGQYALDNSVPHRPLYTLSDDDVQQQMVKSTLKSVSVNSGKVIIVLKGM
jgi:hypothetical protein